jgi:hypothetical protein
MTVTGTAAGEAGAYWNSSTVEGVRSPTVVTVTVLEVTRIGAVDAPLV